MRRTRQHLGFVALKIEGGILPAEFLRKVVVLEAKGQSAKDYRLPKGTTIKDEIGRAWRIASAEWREYRESSQREDVDKTKLGVAQWLFTLLKVVLGHDDIRPCSVIRMGDRTFPITHKSSGGAVPLVLTTESFRLDKTDLRFGDEGKRRSPHALMQEFLNANEDCLWGIISNGIRLQLLRDNPSLTKPAYIEADLERIFEEQLYSDFAAMWLIFHGSRFACNEAKPFECFLEEWRKEGHETGERALADLRKGVTTALKELGSGFLQANENTVLRTSLESGTLSPNDYFRELLRLVYRLLFLLCVEDRSLLHAADTSESARWLYCKGYSVSRVRECALLRRNYDKYFDLWDALKVTFGGLRKGEKHLGLPALGGLFSDNQCPYLDQSVIGNQYLLRAVFALSFFRTGDVLARVNYRDMGTEELGSVYESLLELHPAIDVEQQPWSFKFAGEGKGVSGSERKLSGSYYTPASLVNELLRSAVDPVIEDIKHRNSDNPRKALLNLKVIDPACGSGHFLLGAARRLAIEVAKLDSSSELSEEAARRHALREVVQSCIYGVDKNDLAVELCKTALWIEAVEPGRPLNFLDAHLRCGDSLVGILDPSEIEKGIPDEAYVALAGDDTATAAELKRKNRNDKYEHSTVQGSVFDQQSMTMIAESREAVDSMPEESIEEIEVKHKAFKKWLYELEQSREEMKANLFVGAFFAEKTKEKISLVPTTEDLNRLKQGMPARFGVVEECRRLANQYKFFHWHLAFSEVFKNGGFDIVLGNPPWEQTELKEKEWFAVRRPDIAEATTGASRKKMIEKLAVDAPRMYREFIDDLKASEAVGQFVRYSERFPLCRRGRINTYAIFAELNSKLSQGQGRVGCIVPTGIATDDTTKLFFQNITETGRLVSLFDFENVKGIFPGVDRRYKFCLLTLAGSMVPKSEADFVFFSHDVEELQDMERHFVLTANDFALLNPNTRTCPIFRTKIDAELTKKLYAAAPVLKQNSEGSDNAWGVSFKQGLFNMTSDSALFKTKEQLLDDGWTLKGNVFEKVINDRTVRFLPLYEAKLVHQFDHRWATYEQLETRDLTDAEKSDPRMVVLPRYWVGSDKVEEQLRDKWKSSWMLGFRGVCRTTDERSAIFSVLPRVGAGHSLFLVMDKFGDVSLACSQLANFNSLVFDYVARQKVGGINFSFYIVEQLPVVAPSVYMAPCPWDASVLLKDWLMPRVLELTYTANDLAGFAQDCCFQGDPFAWDEERRFKLRCELDAAFCFLYHLSSKDIEHVLESFPILKRKDESRFGEYRTKRTISDCFERMRRSGQDGTKYASILSPEPQNPCLVKT